MKSERIGHGTLYEGNAFEVIKTLESESVDMIITSPPYWALRDYGMAGQLGQEKTFTEYLDKLISLFEEARRVLKPSGTCWVNLGDTYSSTYKGDKRNPEDFTGEVNGTSHQGKSVGQPRTVNPEAPEKSLCLIPLRFATAMVDHGWVCRNTVIWHKLNCLPSSAKDRFTVDFEYLFFFTKEPKYFFEQQTEPWVMRENDIRRAKERDFKYTGKYANGYGGSENATGGPIGKPEAGRNKRCVWPIPITPFQDAHFAVYPEELIETPIKAGSPLGGVVMDPFMGSGTTALVCERIGRDWIGIELNPEYCDIIKKRTKDWHGQVRL